MKTWKGVFQGSLWTPAWEWSLTAGRGSWAVFGSLVPVKSCVFFRAGLSWANGSHSPSAPWVGLSHPVHTDPTLDWMEKRCGEITGKCPCAELRRPRLYLSVPQSHHINCLWIQLVQWFICSKFNSTFPVRNSQGDSSHFILMYTLRLLHHGTRSMCSRPSLFVDLVYPLLTEQSQNTK
jgi:hypothetical protein